MGTAMRTHIHHKLQPDRAPEALPPQVQATADNEPTRTLQWATRAALPMAARVPPQLPTRRASRCLEHCYDRQEQYHSAPVPGKKETRGAIKAKTTPTTVAVPHRGQTSRPHCL